MRAASAAPSIFVAVTWASYYPAAALAPRSSGIDGALGRVLAVAFTAMSNGTWPRLKACRNHGCRWAFCDYSRNRSASWCSMQLCGNRTKTRTYRRRHAG